MRHRDDTVGVRLGKLIDEIDDFRELFDALGVLVVSQIEPGQRGDMPDLIFVE